MMACCQCQGLESLFNDKTAAKELKEYRRNGPKTTTQLLISALEAEGVRNLTLLDIGGGVGVVQHELLRAGVCKVTSVDGSSAYLEAARREAERQGTADRVSYYHADFIELAAEIEPADIVTLDRAICCYPDMPALVGLSSQKARQMYGVVYPRDTWWIRLGATVVNFGTWLFRKRYRFFIHPSAEVEAVLSRQGFTERFKRRTFFWQTVIYSR
jgi:magnesium-protoporphyrin O-methyltransferase